MMAILLFAVSPLADASTLTVNLNPNTGVATLDSASSTKIVFTYPANSSVSNYLSNVNSTLNLSGKFDGSFSGVRQLQDSFNEWNQHLSVSNISVAVNFSAIGNTTALVVNKVTQLNATVSGAFTVVNGTATANLGWRAFIVRDAMNLPLEGHNVDINLAGPAMEESIMGSHASAAEWLVSSFGG